MKETINKRFEIILNLNAMFYMNKSKIKCMIDENMHYLIKAVNTSFVAVVVLDDMWLPVLHGTDSIVFVQRAHQDDISTLLGNI